MRRIFGVVVCLGLLVGILRSASPVYAQYPTATPVVATCTGQSGCNTFCTGCGGNGCAPTESYCYTRCTGGITCNSGCAASTTCNATNSNYYCKYNIGCSWFPANDCQGGTCGCGQLRVAVRYCSGVHCDDACSADSVCGTCSGTGPTATPGGPAPTTAPTSTPIPFGTIKARGVQVSPADTTCAAIKAVPVTAGQITGTTHQFTPSSTTQPLPQTQTGADYVTFLGLYAGPYTLDSIPSANWMFARPCWTNETTGATGEGLSQTLVQNQTLRWDIGYTLGTAWVQTQGADVYAAGSVRSYIPDVTPRVFMADGTGRSAGVLQYGTSYDFDSSPYAVGNNLVSSGNWQVSGTKTTVDYYDYFYRRYGAPTIPTTNATFSNLTAVTKPASSATPYYVTGNMTTSGNWVVGTGESIVILVNGNLTIGGRINTTGTGFIAFIVSGNITVADTVGTTWSSVTQVVEGVYIATKADQSG